MCKDIRTMLFDKLGHQWEESNLSIFFLKNTFAWKLTPIQDAW